MKRHALALAIATALLAGCGGNATSADPNPTATKGATSSEKSPASETSDAKTSAEKGDSSASSTDKTPKTADGDKTDAGKTDASAKDGTGEAGEPSGSASGSSSSETSGAASGGESGESSSTKTPDASGEKPAGGDETATTTPTGGESGSDASETSGDNTGATDTGSTGSAETSTGSSATDGTTSPSTDASTDASGGSESGGATKPSTGDTTDIATGSATDGAASGSGESTTAPDAGSESKTPDTGSKEPTVKPETPDPEIKAPDPAVYTGAADWGNEDKATRHKLYTLTNSSLTKITIDGRSYDLPASGNTNGLLGGGNNFGATVGETEYQKLYVKSSPYSQFGFLNAQDDYGRGAFFQQGQITPVADVPTSGSADYQGDVIYSGKLPPSPSGNLATGSIALHANFAAKTVTGDINIPYMQSKGSFYGVYGDETYEPLHLVHQPNRDTNFGLGVLTIEGNTFHTTDNSYSDPRNNGKATLIVNGQFNGPHGEEVSGTFSNRSELYHGAFAAKQTPAEGASPADSAAAGAASTGVTAPTTPSEH